MRLQSAHCAAADASSTLALLCYSSSSCHSWLPHLVRLLVLLLLLPRRFPFQFDRFGRSGDVDTEFALDLVAFDFAFVTGWDAHGIDDAEGDLFILELTV